ncbi:MFS transporter [Pseudoalteromonas sp. Of7M-16]|uniref:MFS transporter n=1 Tax=Pseudoalteromonas sp. Of7M-16 TaxID=2917756 RepID=UPI001EF71BCC|nr:MFS transporter [Pseudoalteromonas sp. Of7M-16]MCG7548832.1 MFS transporter [Pseudoalteromonas sp. Of7M-16]
MNADIIKKKNFFLLWQGSLVSFIGSQLHLIASLAWLKSHPEYTSAIPLYLIAASLPIALMGLFGGALVDRGSSRKMVIFGDLISGVLAVLLGALFIFSDLFDKQWLLMALILITIGIGVCQSLHKPATLKLIKLTVTKDELCDGHAWYEFSNRISAPIGHAIGGFFITVVSFGALYLANGLSFIASAWSESKISRSLEQDNKANEQKKLSLKDVFSGIGEILNNPQYSGIKSIILLVFMLNIFVAPIPALMPFLAVDILGMEINWIGYLFFILGLGLFFGVLISSKVYNKKILGFCIEDLQILIMCGAFLLLYAASNSVGVGLGLFLVGMISSSLSIHLTTRLQEMIPVDATGVVMGFIVSMAYICTPLALLGVAIALKLVALQALTLFFLFSACCLSVYIIIKTVTNRTDWIGRSENVKN